MAKLVGLPAEIFSEILRCTFDVVPRIEKCLQLRLVSKTFNDEILRILVEEDEFSEKRYTWKHIANSEFGLRVWRVALRGAVRVSESKDAHSSLLLPNQRHSAPEQLSSIAGRLISNQGQAAGEQRKERTLPAMPEPSDLRATLSCAIALLLAETDEDGPADEEVSGSGTKAVLEHEHFDDVVRNMFEAMSSLISRHSASMLVLRDDSSNGLRMAERVRQQSSEFFALTTAAYHNKHAITKKLLDMTAKRLEVQIGQIQPEIVNDEEDVNVTDWQLALSACLFSSSHHKDQIIFKHVFNLEPNLSGHSFCSIDFNNEDLLLHVAKTRSADQLRLMIDRGWLVVRNGTEPTTTFYRQAIERVSRGLKGVPGRTESLHMLLKASDIWQSKSLLKRLLWRISYDDEVEMAEFMLNLFNGRYTSGIDYATPFKHSAGNPLKRTIKRGNMKMFRFLLKHRHVFCEVLGDEEYMQPQQVVGALIYDSDDESEDNDSAFLGELIRTFPKLDWGMTFIYYADLLSEDCFRTFAQNVNLDEQYGSPDTKVVGEQVLSTVLGALQVEKAKIMTQEFWFNRVAPPVTSCEISEDDVDQIHALEEISKWISGIKVNVQTKKTYTVSFGKEEVPVKERKTSKKKRQSAANKTTK